MAAGEMEASMPDDPNDKRRRKQPSSFVVRTISTIVLLALLFATIWGGHIPCALALLLFQVRCRSCVHLADGSMLSTCLWSPRGATRAPQRACR